MKLYLHAYCLDPDKASPGVEDLWVGPFDWAAITWDNLRAGHDDRYDGDDHQFMRDDTGFWYPMLHLLTKPDNRSGSMQPDYGRGRFSDIEMVLLDERKAEPRAWRELLYEDDDGRRAAELAEEHEKEWQALADDD